MGWILSLWYRDEKEGMHLRSIAMVSDNTGIRRGPPRKVRRYSLAADRYRASR